MADIRQSATVLDDFNRANENPLSGGGNWAQTDFASGFQALELKDNMVFDQPGGNSSNSHWTPLSMDGNDAECWALTWGGNQPAIAWGIGLFSSVGGTNAADGYLWRMEVTTGGGTCRMYKATNWSFTQVDVNTANPPTGGGWLGLIRRNGGDVEGWASVDGGANWTLYVSVTDSTYTTGLYGTLHLTGNGLAWDNFGAGPHRLRRPQIYRVLRVGAV